MHSPLHVVRKASHAPQPWKNGGGITHEIAREPAVGDDFRCRVSLAHIRSSGAFSDFAAYDRKMILLEGDGLELQFAGGRRHELREVGDIAEFDGALATECRLFGGPCVDLNVMVAKPLAAAVRVERLPGPPGRVVASASGVQSLLVFALNDSLAVDTGMADLCLDRWDLAILPAGGRIGCSGTGLVVLATIAHATGGAVWQPA